MEVAQLKRKYQDLFLLFLRKILSSAGREKVPEV